MLTFEAVDYIHAHGTPSYALYNEVIGVLECVKQEMYRRLVAPYEEKKKNEYGDVYVPEATE